MQTTSKHQLRALWIVVLVALLIGLAVPVARDASCPISPGEQSAAE